MHENSKSTSRRSSRKSSRSDTRAPHTAPAPAPTPAPPLKTIRVCDKTTAANELRRTYRYPPALGLSDITIAHPVLVTHQPGGAHIVLDSRGYSHRVPAGFHRVDPIYFPDCTAFEAREDPRV